MQDLDGGLAVEAGVDFTGGIPEVINLEARTGDEEKKLFSLLKGVDWKKDERFLSSSLAGPSGMGLEARQVKIKDSTYYIPHHCLLAILSIHSNLILVFRHAYSITGFFQLHLRDGTKVRLARVRNPHGNEDEWKGAWRDTDEKRWSMVGKEDKHLHVAKNDGEFFMEFRDFVRYFGEMEVVHVRPDSMVVEGGKTKRWDVFHFANKWEGDTAGGCGNDSIGESETRLSHPFLYFPLR